MAKLHYKPTKVYYLKLHEAANAQNQPETNTSFTRLNTPIKPKTYLDYYNKVGQNYNWNNRNNIDHLTLNTLINAEHTSIFIYNIANTPMGFVELIKTTNYTEILYFGLFPKAIGKGQGTLFLQQVIALAWQNNPKWVQLLSLIHI